MSEETLVTNARLARCKLQAVKRILDSPNRVLAAFERIARMSGYNYKDKCPRKRAIGLEINLEELIKKKIVMYDHKLSRKESKWSGKTTLKKIDIGFLPTYLSYNMLKYKEWLD